MAIAALVLEYLKALLSPQCVAGIVALVFLWRFRDDIRALMKRVASIKLPGGAELSAPQLERAENEKIAAKEPSALSAGTAPALPEGLHLTPEQASAVAEAFRAERAKAYLWEYRYLNYFLVPNTQRVLDWLAGLKERTTYGWVPSTCAGDLRGLLMVALRSQGNWSWEGPLGTPLGLVHCKRASSPVEAGTAGYL